jgi:hypothetical protein
MKISIEYANDVSEIRFVNAEFTAEEVRDIFAAANGDVNYICHAIYTHARSKVAKKSSFLNKDTVTESEIDKFERSKFCYYALCEAEVNQFVRESQTLTYQVMTWLQKENDLADGDYIFSELGRIPRFNSEYRKLGTAGFQSYRSARMVLLNEMVEKKAGNLKVEFLYI